jgi:hypothetical protein
MLFVLFILDITTCLSPLSRSSLILCLTHFFISTLLTYLSTLLIFSSSLSIVSSPYPIFSLHPPCGGFTFPSYQYPFASTSSPQTTSWYKEISIITIFEGRFQNFFQHY